MADQANAEAADGPKTPVELLEAQIQFLGEISRHQRDGIREMKRQNEQLERLTKALADWRQAAAGRTASITVENFDMPLGDMAGLLVKFALASIPATVFLGVLWYLLGYYLLPYLIEVR